jgi:hypothetical protein
MEISQCTNQCEELIHSITISFRRGEIDRRGFLSKLLRAGISARVAYGLLAATSVKTIAIQAGEPHIRTEPVSPLSPQTPLPDPEKIDPKMMEDQTKKLINVTSHPEVLKVMRNIQEAPKSQRSRLATNFVKQMQDPEFRNEIGLDHREFPEGFRVSTRVFENPRAPKTLAATKTKIPLSPPTVGIPSPSDPSSSPTVGVPSPSDPSSSPTVGESAMPDPHRQRLPEIPINNQSAATVCASCGFGICISVGGEP